jgi:predicted dehydrogenase
MTIHRRDFMQATIGAAAAVSLASRAGRALAANVDDIRVAQIGFNGQGKGHIGNLGKHIVALCDIDEDVLNRMGDNLDEKLGHKVERFTDYRKLLESKDIDAVSIATPNHSHASITIAAVQAGKHVYVEKPASHNVWEGRQMCAAADRYGKLIQVGTQSRSSAALKEAAKWVHDGGLGAIRYAVATCYKPRKSIGKLDKALQIPTTVHYDLWCGPAEKRELFRPKMHYDWHWDFNTGCGDLGNQGIHQMDIARWFLGEKTLAPRVISVGGRLGYDDAGDTANTQTCFHAYEKAPLIFEVRGLPRTLANQERRWDESMDRYRGAGVGVVVQCEKGYVLIPSYHDATAFDNDGNVVKEWDEGGGHHDNWLEAIAAGDRGMLNADIVEGHLSSALCHTPNVSYRLGKKARAGEIAEAVAANELLANSVDRMFGHLRANGVDIDREEAVTLGEWLTVDPKTEQFVDNDAASELWTRKYREPFVIPDLEGDTAVAAAG